MSWCFWWKDLMSLNLKGALRISKKSLRQSLSKWRAKLQARSYIRGQLVLWKHVINRVPCNKAVGECQLHFFSIYPCDMLVHWSVLRGRWYNHRARLYTLVHSLLPSLHALCILSCLQILATALLMVGVMALTDIRHSNGKNSHLVPFYAGGLVAALCMAFGLNCGCPLNPARDLAPRIFTSIAGWGIKPFRWEVTCFFVPDDSSRMPLLLFGFGTWWFFQVQRHIFWTRRTWLEDANDCVYLSTWLNVQVRLYAYTLCDVTVWVFNNRSTDPDLCHWVFIKDKTYPERTLIERSTRSPPDGMFRWYG